MFAYAFLFQANQDFSTVAWFNLGFYCTLPIGYLLNARLLQTLSLRTASIIGLVGQAIVFFTLFFFPTTLSNLAVLCFGLALGVPMGLYWSARLFLFTIEVPAHQRDYISGITNSGHSLFQLTIPMLIGWFIATATPTFGLPKLTAYQIVAAVAALFFCVSGFVLQKHSSVVPKIVRLRIPKVSKQWQWFRAFVFLGSVQFTITLAVPESLIVGYVGNEAVLGIVSTATQLAAAIALFLAGRVVNAQQRNTILRYSMIPILFGSILLLMKFTHTTVVLYLFTLSIFDAFFWFVYFPVLSDLVDAQTNGSPEHSYPFFIDHELTINAGRILTSLVYIWLLNNTEQTIAVRSAIVAAALSQLALLYASRKLQQKTPPSTLADEPIAFK